MSESAAGVPRETGDARFDQEVLGAGGPGAAGRISVPVTWAPADECALPTAEQPLRVAEFDALFATALRGVRRPAPSWLRLNLDAAAGVVERTRDLTARESSCCAFFDFRLSTGDDGLTLDVRVPEARIEVLDGLARRAEAARAGVETGSR